MKVCTLYRHFDATSALLYVGISDKAGSRTAQHEERAEWWAQVARIEFEKFESREAALMAEQAAIWRERPRFNKARSQSPAVILPLEPPAGGWPRHLSKRVYFLNPSWAVTEYGLECLTNPYEFEASRVSEKWHGGEWYDWPLHMFGKIWVNIEEFCEALEFALRAFPGHALDRPRWQATMRELARRRGVREDYDHHEHWEKVGGTVLPMWRLKAGGAA